MRATVSHVVAASSTPPSPPPADDLSDRLLAGRYRLARPIASGGMAQVWEAVDEILARRVAIKILHRHLAADKTFVDRFRAEAIAAARLAHSSIVSIYDTFSDDGVEAIVMELVRGTTLRTRLDEHGPLAVSETIAIGAQVCDALGIAHRSGLVHRDVKPANILLSDDGRVLVADFGIAKAAADADLTRDGVMLGTAKYVAPEQVEGGAVDARTDLYALGVVLYEALCGRAPFVADTEAATALARLHRDPLRPRQIRAGIPHAVEDVILRALARDPTARFSDAASLRAALLAAGDARDSRKVPRVDKPAAAAPRREPQPLEERPSFARSERAWLVPTTLIVLIAVALGVAGLLLGRSSTGRQLLDQVRGVAGAKPIEAKPQRLVSAAAYDPFGDNRSENNDRAARAIDADLNSTWQTEHYQDPALVSVKPGVGLIVTVEKPTDLRQLLVNSPTGGWAAEVYLANGVPPLRFKDWGEPVDRHENIAAGDITFALHGKKANAILIWITHLSAGGRAEIANVRVTGNSAS